MNNLGVQSLIAYATKRNIVDESSTRAAVGLIARTESGLDETARMVRAVGSEALVLPVDVTDQSRPPQVIHTIESRFGSVDILVNNAGVLGLGSIATVDPTAWWNTFEVNVRAPMLWVQAVLPGMLSRKQGRIINVTSEGAKMTLPNGSAYIASKAALSRMTAVLDTEVRDQGVLVFAFGPKASTAMTDELGSSTALTEQQREWFRAAAASDPDGRLARSLTLFAELLSGRLDHLAGRHLESEYPIESQVG